MQKDIHPKYNDITVTCSCGEAFTTRSTGKDLHIEICSKCHPFYTGQQKLIDTEGRVDRFKERFAGFGKAPAKKQDDQAQSK